MLPVSRPIESGGFDPGTVAAPEGIPVVTIAFSLDFTPGSTDPANGTPPFLIPGLGTAQRV